MTESEFQEFIITIGYRYCEKAKTAFNSFEGFHTRIEFNADENRYNFLLEADTENQTYSKEIEEKLREFASESQNNVIKASYSNKTVNISLKTTIDSEIDKEKLKQTAKFIMDLCKSGNIFPICRVCSRKDKTGLYIVGRKIVPMCDSCVEKKRRQYEHRKNIFELKTQNMPAGIAGAVFGALFGAAIYVLLYQFMSLFGTAAIFIAVFSFIGFVVTGQRATRKSAIICMFISAGALFFAEYASITANMAILIEQQGGGIAVSEAIEAINMSLTDIDYLLSVLFDIFIGIVVINLAGIVYFLKRKYTRPLKISKNIL